MLHFEQLIKTCRRRISDRPFVWLGSRRHSGRYVRAIEVRKHLNPITSRRKDGRLLCNVQKFTASVVHSICQQRYSAISRGTPCVLLVGARRKMLGLYRLIPAAFNLVRARCKPRRPIKIFCRVSFLIVA